jgi:multiple sugar transport system permease protein
MASPTPDKASPRKRDRDPRRRRLQVSEQLLPYFCIGPTALLVAGAVIYPLGYVVVLGLFDYSPYLGTAMRWTGAANYVAVLQDPAFWNSLWASLVWVVGSVVPQFLLGLGMALVLNESFRGRGIVRTIVLAPWAVSGVVTGVIWLWLFDGTIGVINDLLMRARLTDFPVAWGIHAETTWLMLFVANAWRGAPFFAIVLLAALQAIDPGLYEAARIDGAGRWQRFRHVTLPLILNAVVISTLLRALWTFNFIDLIWTMTRGGPIDTTKTLPIYIFDVAYQKGDFGYAAALSVVLCMLLLTFAAAYWQLNRLTRQE